MFGKNLFRDKAMERLSSPDEFDDPVKIISVRAWILFLLLFVASSALIIWIFFSRINREINCAGLILKENKIAEVHTLSAGLIEKVFVKRGSGVKKGDALLTVVLAQGKEKTVVSSPAGGSVFELNVSEGNFVNTGEKLLSIEKEDTAGSSENFEVTAFVSGKNIHSVKIDNPVFIAPKNIDIKEYGYLIGKVKSIANYPVSQERKNQLIKENPLMAAFLQDEIFEAAITPLRENGKLKWSSERGNEIKSVNGSNCNLKIIVSGKNISGYVFK